MRRPRIELVAPCAFDDPSEVHDGYLIRKVLHDREIVRNEQVRQASFPLKLVEQIEDLRLYGYVERADRFIADDEVRVARQCAGDTDPLALPA